MTTKSIHSTYISVGIIIFLIALLGLNLHLNSLSNLNSLNQNVYIKSMNMVNENHDRLLKIINKEPIFTNLKILDLETVNGFRPNCVQAIRSSLIESDDIFGDFNKIQKLLTQNPGIYITYIVDHNMSFTLKNSIYNYSIISIDNRFLNQEIDELGDMPGLWNRVIFVEIVITMDKNGTNHCGI